MRKAIERACAPPRRRRGGRVSACARRVAVAPRQRPVRRRRLPEPAPTARAIGRRNPYPRRRSRARIAHGPHRIARGPHRITFPSPALH
ncbi:hypothetical protein AQ883_19240 [Burkholderia pseudomallei]|nr:hypothetical protein CXQ84_27635 [Burkholderia pseudomallei]EDU11102.1 hypothetical protein BURPS1655_I0715 [Burkholderia pseudomallei 1655]EMP74867.1 hypothetical protein D512_22396 [Burkholderia pseudomallei MSHR1043]OMZ46063.1 hypothetical protein AQ863_07490 [Burkholderia pseudomallei]OMZ53922.1 hypothetical protein AQ864_24700 [Burkholderia pseudomallei]